MSHNFYMIMSFDEISNTSLGLDLGLGLHEQYHQAKNFMKKKEDRSFNIKAYPIVSLTLGPTTIDDFDDDDDHNQEQKASKIIEGSSNNSESGVSNSSFFNSSTIISSIEIGVSTIVRNERDHELFEVKIDEKVILSSIRSRDVDDIIEDGNPRRKFRLTKEQSSILEENFKEHSTLNPKQKQELAKKLNLRPRQVEVWFQNRRARTKLKQTESECEFLRKRCETLKQENKRLQNELQELRTLQTTAPFYMQIPSCERICSGNNNHKNNNNNNIIISSPKTTTTLLFAGSKAHNLDHFYTNNSFQFSHSSSSAACST